MLKQNKEEGKFPDVDDLITESIKQAFLEVENQYILSARIAYGIGKFTLTQVSEELRGQEPAL